MRGDGRPPDARLGGEHRLDLPRLDPEAADLDLLVGAAEEVEPAAGAAPDAVAGPVEAGAGRAERVRDEPLRRAGGVAEIAARQAVAGEVQLPDRDLAERAVQDVRAGVGDGAQAAVPVARQGDQAVARRLRAAVQVEQPSRDPVGERGGQRLPAADPGGDRGGRAALHQGGEQARDERDQPGPVPFDEVGQRDGVGGGRVVGDDDRVPGGEAAEQLGRPVDERGRALGHADPGGGEARPPGEPVGEGALRADDRLRRAGRSGGEDDVGRVVRVDVRPCAARRVQRRLVLSEDQQRADGVQHHPHACGRVREVDRQVRRARLEDGEQCHGELLRARQGERDDPLGSRAGRGEPVGEGLGAAVQVGVGEDGVAEHHRGRVRGPRDLLLDEGGDRPGGELAGGVGVLDGRPEGRQAPVRRLGDLGEQRAQVVQQPLDGRGVEEVGGERGEPLDVVVALGEVQVEVELHAAGLGQERLGAHARQGEAHVVQPLVDDHHLEQRAAGERPLGREPVHHPLERDAGVRERREVGGPHPVEQLGERGVAGQVGAQDERVDEDADQAGEVLVGASRDGRAERDVVARPGPLQQRRDGGVQHHEHAGARLAGQAPRPGGRQPERDEPAAVARLRRARPVEREERLLRRPGEGLLPEVELRRRVGRGLALPGRVVGVLDGQRLPARVASVPAGLVGVREVGEQGREGPLVGGGVVEKEDERPVVVSRPDEGAADGQVGADVEDVGGGVLLDGRAPLGGLGARVDDGEAGEDVRALDALDGQPVRPLDQQGPQRFVARDDVAEGPVERVRVHGAVQAEPERQGVGGRRAAEAFLQPEAALRGRRRDDLRPLHVADADGVGRHQPGRQRRDGRRLEDVRDGQRPAEDGAGLGGDARRQERVPAEREEVVVDADALHPEQLGEDRAEGGLAGVAGARPETSASGAGSAARSSLPLTVRGSASSATSADGTMYSGSAFASASRRAARPPPRMGRSSRPASRHPGGPPGRRPRPARRPAARRARPAPRRASIRKPRILTWSSVRPRYSIDPSRARRARSPVRYMRDPGSPNGSATNRSAVRSGRPTYPRASCSPARYSSPGTPGGTGRSLASRTCARVFQKGRPMPDAGRSAEVAQIVASVGPYMSVAREAASARDSARAGAAPRRRPGRAGP
nr:hypothetical protein [Actinomadura madurae]